MKIETGCLALVVCKGKNFGKGVTVGKYIGEVDYMPYKDLWAVDRQLTVFAKTGSFYTRTGFVNLCPEKFLMRIDGLTEEKQNEKTSHIVNDKETHLA